MTWCVTLSFSIDILNNIKKTYFPSSYIKVNTNKASAIFFFHHETLCFWKKEKGTLLGNADLQGCHYRKLDNWSVLF